MPVVYANTEIFSDLFKGLRGFKSPVCLLTFGWGCRPITQRSTILLHRGKNWCTSEIRWIWPPFAFGNFDGDQACETLLLPRPSQRRILAPDRHCRRRYWVLGYTCSGTAECCFHRLDVVIVPPARVVIVIMGITIFARGVDAASVRTFIPVMLLTPSLTPVSFNSLPLHVPVLSFLFPFHLSRILRM